MSQDLHLRSFLHAADELVHVFLGDVPIQVRQVGVKTDKGRERDPRGAALLVLRQDLTCELQRSHEALK